MKTPENKIKKAKQVNDSHNRTGYKHEVVDASLDEIIPLEFNPRSGSSSNSALTGTHNRNIFSKDQFENEDVPIYKLNTTGYSLKATLSDDKDALFAEGCLIGSFYTTEGQVKLQKVKFYGNFKGVV